MKSAQAVRYNLDFGSLFVVMPWTTISSFENIFLRVVSMLRCSFDVFDFCFGCVVHHVAFKMRCGLLSFVICACWHDLRTNLVCTCTIVRDS